VFLDWVLCPLSKDQYGGKKNVGRWSIVDIVLSHKNTAILGLCGQWRVCTWTRKKTANQNTSSTKYFVLIGQFLSTSTKILLENFMSVRPGQKIDMPLSIQTRIQLSAPNIALYFI
jgi:hypothetical protein